MLGLLVVAGVIAYLYLGRRDPREGGNGAELGPDGDPPRKAGAGIIPELLDLIPGVSREEAEDLASAIPGAVETNTERPPVRIVHDPAPYTPPPDDTIEPWAPMPINEPIRDPGPIKPGPIAVGGGGTISITFPKTTYPTITRR